MLYIISLICIEQSEDLSDREYLISICAKCTELRFNRYRNAQSTTERPFAKRCQTELRLPGSIDTTSLPAECIFVLNESKYHPLETAFQIYNTQRYFMLTFPNNLDIINTYSFEFIHGIIFDFRNDEFYGLVMCLLNHKVLS